jgi:hypothetical protein
VAGAAPVASPDRSVALLHGVRSLFVEGSDISENSNEHLNVFDRKGSDSVSCTSEPGKRRVWDEKDGLVYIRSDINPNWHRPDG